MEDVRTIDRQIDALITKERLPWSRHGSTITISFANERRHKVRVLESGEDYIFEGRVLKSDLVCTTTESWRALAYRVWRRNAVKDIVSFSFDKDDNLIGRVIQPIHSLDVAELILYVNVLARECDELEYLLTGEDVE